MLPDSILWFKAPEHGLGKTSYVNILVITSELLLVCLQANNRVLKSQLPNFN